MCPPTDDDSNSSAQPIPLQRLTLSQMMGPPPPPQTAERLAWCMHLLGYLVTPKQRVTTFGPVFLEDYEDTLAALPADRSIWKCVAILSRLAFWTCLSVA